jgi:hypothetical protein
MDFNASRYGQHLTARKAYFLMDGVLLNLGAAVQSRAGYTVTTTLDSRLLSADTDVLVSTDGGGSFSPVERGNHTYALRATASGGSAPSLLVAHGGMGFAVFPVKSSSGAPKAAVLLNDVVTANWSDVRKQRLCYTMFHRFLICSALMNLRL